MWVADSQNFKVVKFAPDGRALADYDRIGTGTRRSVRPSGVAVAPSEWHLHRRAWGLRLPGRDSARHRGSPDGGEDRRRGGGRGHGAREAARVAQLRAARRRAPEVLGTGDASRAGANSPAADYLKWCLQVQRAKRPTWPPERRNPGSGIHRRRSRPGPHAALASATAEDLKAIADTTGKVAKQRAAPLNDCRRIWRTRHGADAGAVQSLCHLADPFTFTAAIHPLIELAAADNRVAACVAMDQDEMANFESAVGAWRTTRSERPGRSGSAHPDVWRRGQAAARRVPRQVVAQLVT